MQRPRYKNPSLNSFVVFRRGPKVVNGLYGYAMYENDSTVQNNITKNARVRFNEVNQDYGGGTGVDEWVIIPFNLPGSPANRP